MLKNSTTIDSSQKQPTVIIAVVSHHNAEEIINLLKPHTLAGGSREITPVILSNTACTRLERYCEIHSLIYIENRQEKGFGANNNIIFDFAYKKLHILPDDYFFCINPDIETARESIGEIAEIMDANKLDIAAPNLLDENGQPEDNIRSYPKLTDMVFRLLLKSQRTRLEKQGIREITTVDWASGAFLCFRAGVYRQLRGFNEKYFMYYEDAEICLRGSKLGYKTHYLPQIQATHRAQRKSRTMLSTALLWHIKSAIRFALTSKGS